MSDTKAMQRLCGLMRKAVQQYEMLAPGDRVLVGVSGGKDSLALLVALMQGASWFSQNSQKQRNPQLEELARTLAQQVVLNLAPLMRSETPDEKRINQLLTQLTHNSRVLDAGVYD